MKLRVALAQINPTVGDLAGDASLISKYTEQAIAAAADVVVFPEVVLLAIQLKILRCAHPLEVQAKTHRPNLLQRLIHRLSRLLVPR